jgi:hypothetical protein
LSPEEVKIIFAGKELHDLIVIEVIFFLFVSPYLYPVWFSLLYSNQCLGYSYVGELTSALF